MPLTLEFASRQVGPVFGPEVAWHARLVLHDISRLLLLPFYAAIPAGAWFWGAGRTDEDGKTRIVSSLLLRFLAALAQFMTVFTFFGHKADLLFIFDAHRWWGACAAIVLVTNPVLIVWALIMRAGVKIGHSTPRERCVAAE